MKRLLLTVFLIIAIACAWAALEIALLGGAAIHG